MKIRPLSDWVCLKQVEYKHPLFYVHGAKTHKGIVVAVGKGKRLKKWIEVKDPLNGKTFRTRAGNETGYIAPMHIKWGDVVEYSDHGWEERIINGEKYVFTRQDSVIGFSDLEDTEGLQGHVGAIIP